MKRAQHKMDLVLTDTFEQCGASGFPKLVEGDVANTRRPVLFELANGRFFRYSTDQGGWNFTLLASDRETQIARAYSYRDEEGDQRTNVKSFFALKDFPEWHGESDPHVELDFEISYRGYLQTVSLTRRIKSPDKDSFKQWRDGFAQTSNFPDDEVVLIDKLNGFVKYALGSIMLGNKPDFSSLDGAFKTNLFADIKIPTDDVVVGRFDNFDI